MDNIINLFLSTVNIFNILSIYSSVIFIIMLYSSVVVVCRKGTGLTTEFKKKKENLKLNKTNINEMLYSLPTISLIPTVYLYYN